MRRATAVASLLTLLAAAGCSTAEERSGAPRSPASASSTAPAPTPTPTPRSSDAPAEPEDDLPPTTGQPSLARLMRADFDGRGLRVTATEYRTDTYTRQQVTYRSNGTTVSGVLLRPVGKGPFPAVVLNHGYIDPAVYLTGQGLAREQDWLARAGFVVLHTDYRGHAASDPATDQERELRLAYVRDSINAVLALERLPYVDDDRTAMLGRSMGGGVTLGALAAAPGLVDAAVVYASVSSSYLDNLRHWTIPERPAAAQELFARFGTPQESPGFYRGLSPRTYADRITEPVLMFHGLADTTCPPAWSRTTHRALRAAGVDATLVEYPGEEHAFIARWQDSIERTVRFLEDRLEV